MTLQFLFRSRPRHIGMNKIVFVLIVLVGNVIESKRNGKNVDLFLERRRKSSPFLDEPGTLEEGPAKISEESSNQNREGNLVNNKIAKTRKVSVFNI